MGTLWIIATLVVISLLIITKFLDVLSTLRRIRYASNESNPFARKMMYRWGPKITVWIVFIVALVIIGVAGGVAFTMGPVFQAIFIVFGTFVSVVQFAVARANWTGRDNLITRLIRKRYFSIQKLIK